MVMQMKDEMRCRRGRRVAWTVAIAIVAVLATLLFSTGEGVTCQISANFPLQTIGLTSLATGEEYVYVSGVPIGISIGANGLIVEGQSGVVTESGETFPSKDSGIQKGDIIYEVDNKPISSLYILKRTLDDGKGEVSLSVRRKGNTFETKITPAVDLSGSRKLGLMLKEDLGGIGTLTFVTKDGHFGALGHYIQDSETGLKDELNIGKIYPTSISGVIKGERGRAGGLQAEVNRLSRPLGTVTKNSLIGIYGEYADKPEGDLMRVAGKGEAKMGEAQVLTTIEGDEPALYDIDIVKVISQSDAAEKGMVIAVRDKRLIEKTGGIVQGMSGSPIIQNGALIGAITHVMIEDPTRGYAVHSRFMLDEANEVGEELLQYAA